MFEWVQQKYSVTTMADETTEYMTSKNGDRWWGGGWRVEGGIELEGYENKKSDEITRHTSHLLQKQFLTPFFSGQKSEV